MNIEKVEIKKIVHGGFGLSHLSSGQVLLVRGALPGETVKATVTKTTKNYLSGIVKTIIKAHPMRVVAPCKYYDQCGGCNLQHCHIGTQLTIKKNILLDLLQRSQQEKVQKAAAILSDPLSSPSPFGYRQRIRLQIGEDGRIGFRRFRSHKICQVDSCLLAAPTINSTLNELKEMDEFHKLAGLATEIELQINPQSAKVVCLIHFTRKPRPSDLMAARSICRSLQTMENIFFLGEKFQLTDCYNRREKSPGRHLIVSYPATAWGLRPLKFIWEAGGFSQVNLQQNLQLIRIVFEFAKITENETVLDLFCGMGNFAIPLALLAKQVTGIEGQGGSIRSAKLNAENNGLNNTIFVKSPVHEWCRKTREEGIQFDCLIIDPPRRGVPSLAGDLSGLTKKRLIYISCDPATLCRDLCELTLAGFAIKNIQPVDMFPQTHHIETVVLLEKRSLVT